MPSASLAKRKKPGPPVIAATIQGLTLKQQVSVIQLAATGLSQHAIAEKVGISQATVSNLLATLTDSTDLARQILSAGSHTLAQRIIDTADVDQAITVLTRLKVLAPEQTQSSGDSKVQILIGMPGQPVGLAPAVTVDALPPANRQPNPTGDPGEGERG